MLGTPWEEGRGPGAIAVIARNRRHPTPAGANAAPSGGPVIGKARTPQVSRELTRMNADQNDVGRANCQLLFCQLLIAQFPKLIPRTS